MYLLLIGRYCPKQRNIFALNKTKKKEGRIEKHIQTHLVGKKHTKTVGPLREGRVEIYEPLSKKQRSRKEVSGL